MRLSQLLNEQGQKMVCATDANGISRKLAGVSDIRSLAMGVVNSQTNLPAVVNDHLTDEVIDLGAALESGRVLTPIDHPDPAHLLVSGSGLSHKAWVTVEPDHGTDESTWPDHYKTLMLGQRGGKPATGNWGAQPEWFFKGNGDIIVPPGRAVEHPFYGDGPGEEAEIAGIYLIGPDKTPFCIGYTLGNEFSDEQMYFKNVYHLAQSKKRHVSLGPELLVGDLPDDIPARISLHRGDRVQWQADFRTGEANMLHSIANIEAHYFKYSEWYIPGDIHVLYLGNAVMSTAQGEVVEDGDVFQLDCEIFGLPLINSVRFGTPFPIPRAQPLW
ncbi:Fumarylacetoacetate (FAA) hydrolase family protein [Roseovarius albus]|uniref:Fumarylacetoacetate (FAA) hydrolase family protein n=1 Tax=Roseovarius albus TaxID=1247867 RepID=A0A1X7A8W4_9RHOB|nr:AraD1 family protein [Roseovarius albus]SLN73472.1 Fumarylacetoacetate (FAA) hydrolase family protein [Roseovarius albus]